MIQLPWMPVSKMWNSVQQLDNVDKEHFTLVILPSGTVLAFSRPRKNFTECIERSNVTQDNILQIGPDIVDLVYDNIPYCLTTFTCLGRKK